MNSHIRDIDLLMDIDGELAHGRSSEVRRHLEGCAQCRERRSAIERSMVVDQGIPLPSPAISRAQLQRQMTFSWRRPYIYAAASLVLLAGIAHQAWWWRLVRTVTPDARLTPGATVPVSREAICVVPDAPRPVAASLAMRVFAHYGINNPRPRTFEVDYLITPALGGSDDIRNLWPQPYSAGVWNSRVKDALEDKLRQLVCEGKLDLEAAQREIASDWIAAYKKYFRTEYPLAVHLSFVKDPPWED
jgi:hypothetical protein